MADDIKIENTEPKQLGEEDEKIKKMVLSNYHESYNYLNSSRYFEDNKTWYNQYMSLPKDKPYKWMNNKFIPFTHAKVESGIANLMGMFFQNKPIVEIQSRPFGKGDAYHAGLWRQVLNYHTENESFYNKFMQYIKVCLIYGTAIGKAYWSNAVRKIKAKIRKVNPVKDFINNMAGKEIFEYEYKTVTKEIKNGPTFDVLNIGDSYPDPMAIEINDGWFIHKTTKSINYLRSMNPRVYNDEVQKLTGADAVASKDGKYEIEGAEGRQTQGINVTRPTLGNNVEILEWVGWYPLTQSDELEMCIFTVAAGKYLIRKQKYPFWTTNTNNYVKSTYIQLPNEFMGMGMPEEMNDLQNVANELVNQRFDNVSFVNNPRAKYKKNTGINLTSLKNMPGAPVGVDDINDLAWDRPPDVTQSNFATVMDVERWMQEVTIPKITQGVGGAGQNDTATGMAILQKGAMDKLTLAAKNIESTGYLKIMQMFMELDYQFYDADDIASITGADKKLIDMELMRPDYYEIVISGVKSFMDRNQKAMKLLQFMNLAKDEPDFDMRKALKKYYELLDISDNPNELMRSEEQAMKLRQAQMIKEMMIPMMIKSGGSGGGGEMPTGEGSEGTQFTGIEGGATTPGVPPVSGQMAPPPAPEIGG